MRCRLCQRQRAMKEGIRGSGEKEGDLRREASGFETGKNSDPDQHDDKRKGMVRRRRQWLIQMSDALETQFEGSSS